MTSSMPRRSLAPASIPPRFWSGFAALLSDLAPRCAALLAKRDTLQSAIDAWHLAQRGKPFDQDAYLEFLRDIGYLVAEPARFRGRHQQRRSRDRHHRRAATRRAGHQRPLCAERGERALGFSCTMRCTAPTRCPRMTAPPAAGGFNKVRAAQGRGEGARDPRRARCRWPPAATPTRRAMPCVDGRARRSR